MHLQSFAHTIYKPACDSSIHVTVHFQVGVYRIHTCGYECVHVCFSLQMCVYRDQ